MEDVNASQQALPEEDFADKLQEGSPSSAEDEEAASFADDSSESSVEPGAVKAMRRLAKHRASLIPLALLASALVFALFKPPPRFPGVSKEELVEGPELPKVEPVGPPRVSGVPEEPSEKPMEPTPPEKLPGVSEEELVEGPEKPKAEPVGPPRVSGVPEEPLKKPMEPPKEKSPGVSKEELVKGPEKSKVQPVGPPGVREVPKETPKKPMVQKLVNHVVLWAKDASVDKNKSLNKDELWDSRLNIVWHRDGVRHSLLAYFTRLTPAYNPEETAKELADIVPKLLERAKLYEKDVREGKNDPLIRSGFGGPGTDEGSLSIYMSRERLE
ncbi:hypothetical protein Emed_006369 [Eimeria media]